MDICSLIVAVADLQTSVMINVLIFNPRTPWLEAKEKEASFLSTSVILEVRLLTRAGSE